jgi:hypothetical protein
MRLWRMVGQLLQSGQVKVVWWLGVREESMCRDIDRIITGGYLLDGEER